VNHELFIDYFQVHTDGDEPTTQGGLDFAVTSGCQEEGEFNQGIASAAEIFQSDDREENRSPSGADLLRRAANREHLVARLGATGDRALSPFVQFLAERIQLLRCDCGEVFAVKDRLLGSQT